MINHNNGTGTVFMRLVVLIATTFLPIFAQGAGPSLNTPAPGSTLPPASQATTFSWAENDTTVLDWWLYVGTSVGGKQLHNSGLLGAATQSVNVNGLPINGSTFHARLWYKVGTAWEFVDSSYTSHNVSPPTLILPLAGTVLAGVNQRLEWTDNGTAVEKWWLYAGTTEGGRQLHNSGILGGAARAHIARNLPNDGSIVYVRLWYRMHSTWHHMDYTFNANGSTPALTLPSGTTTLRGKSEDFTWEPNGVGVLGMVAFNR